MPFTARERWLVRFLNVYPPYLGAGVRARAVDEGGRRAIEVEMRLRWWNRNYVGTHFGGSLASMCDPHFMLLLLWELGPEYLVWDKAATIRYRKPGRGTVRARFAIPAARVEEIRRATAGGGKVEPVFETAVVDDSGEVVAEVEKLLWVRRKDASRTAPPAP